MNRRTLVKRLEQQGFRVERAKSGHLKVRKDGRLVAVMSGTASEYRAGRNALAQLRRAGFRG